MDTLDNHILNELPEDIVKTITSYLQEDDLSKCMRLSHANHDFFSSDIIWEPIASKHKVKKNEIDIFHQFFLDHPKFFAWLPDSVHSDLANDYKSLIHRKYISDVQNTYPKEFLNLFKDPDLIRRQPFKEVSLGEMKYFHSPLRGQHCFDEQFFTHPIVIAKLKGFNQQVNYFILFRIKNNFTGRVFYDAIGFYSSGTIRFFNNQYTLWSQKIICPYMHGVEVKPDRIDYVQRLIERKPVGVITLENESGIIEGPKTLSNGSSMLELC